jgi:hypothetical protein
MDLPVDRLGGAGNTTGRGWASDFGLLDSRIRLLLVGFASFGLTMAWFALRDLGLPYDRIYQATLFLMWPRGGLGDGPVRLSLLSLDLLCPLLALVLLSAVLLPRSIIGRPPAVLRLAYRYALVLPVFAFVTTTLARLVSNGIYALAGRVTWDGTAAIARFETPLIEALQGGVAGGLLSHVCAAIYAGGWMLSLLAVPVVLMALGRHEGVAQIAVGWMLAALIAAPT